MNAVMEHLQHNLIPYIVLSVGLIIFIYATRRYSIPMIQYALEVIIYCAGMHIVVWAIASGAAAFKRASSFKALAADRDAAATWTTPILHFWKLEEYDPLWLSKLEMVFVAIILILVWRLRPMKIQKSTRATAPMARRTAMATGGRGAARSFGRTGGRRK